MKKIVVAILFACIFSMLLGTSTALATPDLIAVAPDNADVIASADPVTNEVKVSTNGGAIWINLGVPEETGGNPAIAIYDIAISHQTDGIHYIAVAGTDNTSVANIWYFDLGNAPPTWTEINDLPGYSAPGANSGAFAIAFSPAFPLDKVMVAITAVWDGGSNADHIFFEMFSFNTEHWNDFAGPDYPVTVASDDGITGLKSASILLDPTYLASDDQKRLAFVNLSVVGDADARLLSGLYRLDDYVVSRVTTSLIAVAPDNANVIASADTVTNEVKVSTNGGANWTNLGVPEETGGNPAKAIYDIAISHQTDSIYYIAVAGTDSANVANIWYFDLGDTAQTWTGINDKDGYSAPGANSGAFAIAFSPAFPIDYAMVAITAVWDGDSNADNISFEAFSFNTYIWNSDAGFWGYPVTIASADGITDIESASILLGPAYIAFPAEKRLAFVNLSVAGDADAGLLSGLYRLQDYPYPEYPVVSRVTTSEVLMDLKDDVENSDVSFGIKSSLIYKLENALKSLENGNDDTALNQLNTFINKVEAQRGKAITTEQADEWIAKAELIIEIILTNH